MKVAITTGSTPIVLRYISKSQWKDGHSPFNEYSIAKSTIKIDGKHDGAVLRKNVVLSPHKACHSKMATTPLLGFVAFSRGLLQEKRELPMVHTSYGFDPNIYKLMKRFDYDFSKRPLLWNVIEGRPYRLNDTQKMRGNGCNTKNWPWLRLIPARESFEAT